MTEAFRFLVNGGVATLVHYAVLKVNLDFLGFASAGVASGIASVFGIAASFAGSRYFVFPGRAASWTSQLGRFSLLYAAIAFLHGLFMAAWHDHFGLAVEPGFLLATAIATVCSFLGNRHFVFAGGGSLAK